MRRGFPDLAVLMLDLSMIGDFGLNCIKAVVIMDSHSFNIRDL